MIDDPFNIDSLMETHKRPQLFRDLGEVLIDDIRGGKLFSPLGSVARLLEMAFRAGEFNSVATPAATARTARLVDEPSRPVVFGGGRTSAHHPSTSVV